MLLRRRVRRRRRRLFSGKGLESRERIKSSTRALSAESNDTDAMAPCCIGLRVELDCKQDHGWRRCISASFVQYIQLYTEAKVDVTQEIEQRAQQAAQSGADHCTLCSISCVTSTLASVYRMWHQVVQKVWPNTAFAVLIKQAMVGKGNFQKTSYKTC